MSEFVMRSYKGKRVHTTILGNIEIRGIRHISGPQPIGGNGAPQLIADLFDADSTIQRILIEREKNGVLYQRMDAEPQEAKP
jgi:hypothetical protein